MKLLETERLSAFYGDLQALFDLNIAVNEGECLALVGANGAGKTTFFRTIIGLIANKRGAIRFNGKDIATTAAEKISALGISLVPEGRLLFPSLTVEENLLMGKENRRRGHWNLDGVYALFPVLAERRRQNPTTLSGGEQQMVSIGRGLMANPTLLLCDEISLGLAPVIVDKIYASFSKIRAEGTSLVLVEQDVKRAMGVADRVVCLLEGRVTLEGRPAEIKQDALTRAYFGG
jgi:branched-chain amino acid transport system ATP-binding protein